MTDAPPLRVLGNRVLVRPDVNSNAPETSTGGIVMAASLAAAITGDDPTVSLCRGTVVGLGTLRHPLYDEATDLAERLESSTLYSVYDSDLLSDAAKLLRDVVRQAPPVGVGDDVLFSHDAGQQVDVKDETFVVLRDTELLAVVDGA